MTNPLSRIQPNDDDDADDDGGNCCSICAMNLILTPQNVKCNQIQLEAESETRSERRKTCRILLKFAHNATPCGATEIIKK